VGVCRRNLFSLRYRYAEESQDCGQSACGLRVAPLNSNTEFALEYGVQARPGQKDAGLALGLTPTETYRFVDFGRPESPLMHGPKNRLGWPSPGLPTGKPLMQPGDHHKDRSYATAGQLIALTRAYPWKRPWPSDAISCVCLLKARSAFFRLLASTEGSARAIIHTIVLEYPGAGHLEDIGDGGV